MTTQVCGCVQNREPRRKQHEVECAVQRDVSCTCLVVFLAHAWRLRVGVGLFSCCDRNGALRPTIWKTSAIP